MVTVKYFGLMDVYYITCLVLTVEADNTFLKLKKSPIKFKGAQIYNLASANVERSGEPQEKKSVYFS